MKKNDVDNYYSSGNRMLTQSKIKDFDKDPNYFYKKHITGEIEEKKTDTLRVGSAVDCWLTESRKAFENKYYVPEGNRKSQADDYDFQLTDNMYKEIVGLCEAVERLTIYTDIMKEYDSQVILYKKCKIGEHFDALAGIPDWIKIDTNNKKCSIIDYKTTQSIVPQKYYFTCIDYGYFLQQAMYQKLVSMMYPQIKEFESWNLATEKDPKGIYKTGLFLLSQDRIKLETIRLDKLIEEIKEEKKFSIADLTWDNYEVIGEDRITSV